jgi:hypothetical protein
MKDLKKSKVIDCVIYVRPDAELPLFQETQEDGLIVNFEKYFFCPIEMIPNFEKFKLDIQEFCAGKTQNVKTT